MAVGTSIPWWAKVGAKLVLSRLPVPYGFWSQVGLFRHGDMANPHRAIHAFLAHAERARAIRPLPHGFTMLEIGPGDSVLSAGVAQALGASASWLVDAGDFARRDPALFYRLDDALRAEGLPTLGLPPGLGFDAILQRLGAVYLTQGLASLRTVAPNSVDLVWSTVVLEHIVRHEFAELLAELSRILKPGGVMSHAIDLRDHLGGSLNNLRFSPERWESTAWRKAGFYTNRMSQSEILEVFANAGLKVLYLRNDLWPQPPLPRTKIHPALRDRSDEDLRVAGFDIVLGRAYA